jgi:stage II sporulation protein D
VKLLHSLSLCFLTGFVSAQQLRIGLFRDNNIQRISLSYNDGSYSIFADTNDFGAILPNEFIEVSFIRKGNIALKKGTEDLGIFSKILVIQNIPGASLVLAPKSPNQKQRKYKDDFELSAGGKGISIVNLVDIDNYVAGVVESEGGAGRPTEYYKVQALISRTYALKYLGRHKKEGFDLCDRVHCQVYHSMVRYSPEIDSAVLATHDIVLETEDGKLIDAYFHANCGGQTSEPHLIWNEEIDYLTSFRDTFCIYTRQASWEKRILQKDWIDFLVLKYSYPIHDSLCASIVCTFDQPERIAFYLHPVFGIPLRDLRDHFDLKSTFFSCYPEGEYVLLKGRGFGHGVGLCQEGAIKMAKLGYTCDQIARYYFPKVQLINFFEQRYFRFVQPSF